MQARKRISTGTAGTSDPIEGAVLSLVAVCKADYGDQWAKQFQGDNEALRMWKRRAYQQLREFTPATIVDGYERAASAKRPFMPSLADIVEGVKAIHATPPAQSIDWKRLPPPAQTKSIGAMALEAMRQRVITPTVRAKIKPAPGGSELPCDACGKTITANEAMPRLVGQKILAVCWECRQA
jgi:hypothetical protein